MQFCTYFDIKYLHRGLALYKSLEMSGESFTLWILCFDDETYEILNSLKLRHAILIRQSEFESGDDTLLSTKENRTRVEYYWTCTPSLPLYILKLRPEIDIIVYVDADVYFISSPLAIFEELASGSILVIPHDFSKEYEGSINAGKYNKGIVTFRTDIHGIACLRWWRERCIEWCFNRHEDGKIGDQGYLNDWPERFPNVVVSSNPGLNAGPWNASKYSFSFGEQGQVLIAGSSLTSYHFHALQFCNSYLAFVIGWEANLSPACLNSVYRPYIGQLLAIEKDLKKIGFNAPIPKAGIPWRYLAGRIRRLQPIRHFMRIK